MTWFDDGRCGFENEVVVVVRIEVYEDAGHKLETPGMKTSVIAGARWVLYGTFEAASCMRTRFSRRASKRTWCRKSGKAMGGAC